MERFLPSQERPEASRDDSRTASRVIDMVDRQMRIANRIKAEFRDNPSGARARIAIATIHGPALQREILGALAEVNEWLRQLETIENT